MNAYIDVANGDAILDTATTIGDVSLTAKNDVVATLIGNAAEVATSVGTITMSSTDGKVDFDGIDVKDTGGISVDLTAKTKIDIDGAGGASTVKNVGGDITATLAGAANATVNYTGKIVDLSATNTGSTISTITNAGTVGNAETSTVTLGNAASGEENKITFAGTVDTINVTGGTGKDNITIAADDVKGGTISLGNGADTLDFTGTGTNGMAVNLSSSTVTFSDTGSTTVAAGKAVEYDSASASAKVVANGTDFTVSGVSTVVGAANNDYIVANAEGTTINGAGGADTMVAGAGADTFTIGATDSLNTALDKITDYTAGTDKLDLVTTPTALVAATVAGNAGAADFVSAADYASSGTTAGTLATDLAAIVLLQGTNAFDDIGDTIAVKITGDSVAGTDAIYVVQNQAANATYDAAADTVVALTGTSTVPTALADFA